MRGSLWVFSLVCFGILFPALGVAYGQATGSIVGWGLQVVVEESALDSLVEVAGGSTHSLGLKPDSTIVAWGGNEYGQCIVPVPNESFVALAVGSYHSLGLKSDGTIVAWGSNWAGQCTVPAPNGGFVAIAGGGDHSLGLKSDGTIVAWGANTSGQCGSSKCGHLETRIPGDPNSDWPA